MILDTTTRKIEIVLGGAPATTNPQIMADWVDFTSTTTTPSSTVSNANGTTAVAIVASPAASTQRKVMNIAVHNVDTAAVTVTIRYNDNASLYTIIKATLSVDDTLIYTDTMGWQVIDSSGNIKNTTASSTGRFIKSTVLTSGTTFTTAINTTTIKVRIQAGGGGGGGTTSVAVSAGLGGGGAAGGYAEKTFAVTGSTAYTYAIGAAGGAGSSAGGTGGTGGNSTFTVGGTTVTANGGLGGVGSVGLTTLGTVLGGTRPAVSTNGDLNASGESGFCAIRLSGLIGNSGKGGSCLFGAGGMDLNVQGAGVAGVGFGAGGSGGCTLNGGAAVAGGAGLAGVIIVDEFS